jgi:hypothetical protein
MLQRTSGQEMKKKSLIVLAAALAIGACCLEIPAIAQTAPPYRGARSSDGHPDLSGIWQSLGTANWNLEDHSPSAPQLYQTGAIGATPGGPGVVVGGDIPYIPEALEIRKKNFANRLSLDPEVKCYMPGIPRATYMPFPFQILQTPSYILMAYEFASADRSINMGKPVAAAVDTWMGTANGRWDGETLVVDSKGFTDGSWFDRAGNFHSDQLHVVERFTLTDADHMQYEATIEDPQVFTRPWTIRMTLYRRVEKNFRLTDFKCVEYAEELLYGDLRKKPSN